MFKLIACDLDETLLNAESKVSSEDVVAIRAARELGVIFVLSSGRSFPTVQDILRDIDLFDEEDEYVISFNGGAVTENKDNRILFYQGISREFADFLYERGLEYDVCIHIYTREISYVYNIDDDERAHLANRMDYIETDERSLDFLAGVDIVKIVYMNPDVEYLNSIAEDLSEYTKESQVSYSSNRYLEFNHKKASKGQGLQFLAKHLGIDISATIAIGDNFNDQSMLEVAGLAVGVQNIVPDLRSAVDYVTQATHDENAVAEVIEKFVLEPAAAVLE